jgi:hypothetical protein
MFRAGYFLQLQAGCNPGVPGKVLPPASGGMDLIPWQQILKHPPAGRQAGSISFGSVIKLAIE